jgi:tryptophanase
MHYPPEPFRIKVTESIRLISPAERESEISPRRFAARRDDN